MKLFSEEVIQDKKGQRTRKWQFCLALWKPGLTWSSRECDISLVFIYKEGNCVSDMESVCEFERRRVSGPYLPLQGNVRVQAWTQYYLLSSYASFSMVSHWWDWLKSSRFSPKFSWQHTRDRAVYQSSEIERTERTRERRRTTTESRQRKKMEISNAMQNIVLTFQSPLSLETAVLIIMNYMLSLIS